MRIWSLHPKYLDTKGLVALWRETLLAKNVLEGKTKGYKNHPQLYRFQNSKQPLDSINFYLYKLWLEASSRNYNFDKSKFILIEDIERIPVTKGQIEFERNHLLGKLKERDRYKQNEVLIVSNIEVHPLFKIVEGKIELWEKVK